MPLRLSKGAERGLHEIFLYWARRASLETADRIIDSIADRFSLLGEHSDAGRASDEVAPGVRCFPAGKFLIYYRKTRRGIEILHIFHGAQDQTRASRKGRMR